MVDSIKSNSPSSGASPQQAKKEASGKSGNALRESFKSLSSGTTVVQAANDVPAVVNVQKRGDTVRVGQLVESLNDAVRYSNEALKALEQASPSSPGAPREIVREFADDLDKLKSDIVDLLGELRNRADAAGIASENIAAAGASLEDVAKAQQKAGSASTQIQLSSEKALGAHEGLTFEKVAQLLAD